jgi:predicted metal-dependent peptidase
MSNSVDIQNNEGVDNSTAPSEKVIVIVKEELPSIPSKVLEEANDNLEKSLMHLISEGRFFSTLLLNMNREFTNRIPTAGVNVTDHINLFINPYFWNSLSSDERLGILKHEAYHVINNHFSRFRDLEPQIFEEKGRSVKDRMEDMSNASTLNQAADYAINEYIPEIPKKFKLFNPDGSPFLEPEKLQDGADNPKAGQALETSPLLVEELKKKIPQANHRDSTEYYYELLKQQQEQDKNNGDSNNQGEGQGSLIDDHSIWHEGSATQDEINEKVKGVVNKALEACDERERGNLPGGIKEAIDKLNYIPKDWRQDLQRFVARTAEILIESSRKKRNRRYGIIYPGYITYPKMHLCIGIDSSGSVVSEELNQFFAEIGRLHKMDIALTVLECDTQITAEYSFDPKKPFLVNGRGGTSFKPVFEKLNDLDVDGIIYFTDGDCFDEGIKKPKIPVLWALVGGKHKKPPYEWGSKTYVEVKKKVSV